MNARSCTPGRAPAILLSLCLCTASACSDDSADGPVEIPLGASLPPLAYSLALTYDSPALSVPRPGAITGHLYLDVSSDGQVTGAISAEDTGRAGLAPISGRVEDHEIVILGGDVDVPSSGSIELEELRITLLDTDGDGEVDGAEGQAGGVWVGTQLDIVDIAMYSSDLSAGLDTTATSASLFVPRDELLPYDAVRVLFEEPLREADVRDDVRVLADGTALGGELVLQAAHGMVTAATFQPDAFLGFGAEVTIDLGALRDPSGNALAAPDARTTVFADPGLLAGNLGFESDLAGWIVLGQASTGGAFEGLAPAEGAAQAVAREGSTLAAALDVPGDATELDLSVALLVLSQSSSANADGKAVITLRTTSGELLEIFDAGDVEAELQPCATCAEHNLSAGPLRRTVDLTPLRGQRVFVIVEVDSVSWFDPTEYTLLLDDIQLR